MGNFQHWVKTHPGWSAKRREATDAELEEHEAYTKNSRGKHYLVIVIYELLDHKKEAKKAERKRKKEEKELREVEAKKPKPAEPPKNRVGPFPFELLPLFLQEQVSPLPMCLRWEWPLVPPRLWRRSRLATICGNLT